MKSGCLEIARATLGEPKRILGSEYLYHCPRHPDAHPSLMINRKKNCFLCGPCGVGGGPWRLIAFLNEINPDDKNGICDWLRRNGL